MLEQSKARIHRAGQKRSCTAVFLMAEHTVDEVVYGALQTKQDMARLLVDDWRSLLQEAV